MNLNGLGDRRPTALLCKINALNDDPRTLKRALFLANLPSEIRNILAGQEFRETEDLAEAADRVWESLSATASVRQVQQMPHANITVEAVAPLRTKPNTVFMASTTPTSAMFLPHEIWTESPQLSTWLQVFFPALQDIGKRQHC